MVQDESDHDRRHWCDQKADDRPIVVLGQTPIVKDNSYTEADDQAAGGQLEILRLFTLTASLRSDEDVKDKSTNCPKQLQQTAKTRHVVSLRIFVEGLPEKTFP